MCKRQVKDVLSRRLRGAGILAGQACLVRSTSHSRAVGAMALSAAIGGEISSTREEVTREHGVCHIHGVACLNSRPKHWRRFEGLESDA